MSISVDDVQAQELGQYDRAAESALRNTQPAPPLVTGIYFLLCGSEIVYVGQSADVIRRVVTHRHEQAKLFDSYTFIECAPCDLTALEVHFIFKYRPRYNSALPPSQEYKSLERIKAYFGLSMATTKGWMKYKGIHSDPGGLYRVSDFAGIEDFKAWIKQERPYINPAQCSIIYLREYIQSQSEMDVAA